MRTIRPSELCALPAQELRSLVLASRPEPGSVRTSWWLGLVEQMIAEVSRGGATTPAAQVEIMQCAARTIGLADECGDMPASASASLLVDLRYAGRPTVSEGSVPEELAADALAWRCLSAIRVDRSEVPELARRQRHHLVDELGQSPISDTDAEGFARLDELGTVLRALRRLRPDISDGGLMARADEWIALEPLLTDRGSGAGPR